MRPLGMTTSHPQQTSDGFFRDVHEPGCGPDTTAFIQMVDDLFRSGFGELGIEQGTAASLGACLSTGATAQQAEPVVARNLAHREMALARATKALACRIDTGKSIQVGSLHEDLLQNRWSLSPGLHTTRRRLSTPLR